MSSPAKLILATYKESFDKLSPKLQRHFAYRASLISKDSFWRKRFLSQEVWTIDQLEELYVVYKANNEREWGGSTPPSISPTKPSDFGRYNIWEKNPELIFWDTYLTHLRYASLFGTDISRYLPTKERFYVLRDICQTSEVLQKAPVWAIEIFYNFKLFANIDSTETLKAQIATSYSSEKYAHSSNYIYALTHVIIGESSIYRHQVAETHWAVHMLRMEWQKALNKSIDILAEVALCLRLAGCRESIAYKTLISKVKYAINRDTGRIQRDINDNMFVTEHRNIVAALALEWQPHGFTHSRA